MRDLILEGTVVAVAADQGHHFSKPSRRDILLVEGHGVEGDAHAGPFVRHRYSRAGDLAYQICGRCT
jgi:hypothetical protein